MADDWGRLGAYVRQRRVQLGYNQGEFAVTAKVAPRTLRTLEGGKPLRAGSLALICDALGWKPASMRAVLGGGEPEETLRVVSVDLGNGRTALVGPADSADIPRLHEALGGGPMYPPTARALLDAMRLHAEAMCRHSEQMTNLARAYQQIEA